jgi:predicted dehydrogenase
MATANSDKVYRIGVIGVGNIAPTYIKGTARFSNVKIDACADLDMARAEAFAKEFNVRALTVEQLVADPDIDIVLNLTVPKVHADVSIAALNAGKHVYTEKPLAISLEDGQRIMEVAQQKGLLVGCAPDTVLGGGIQTCRKLIDDGAIGTPVGAQAFMGSAGPDKWHPNPFFFFEEGGGPMLDMGPYYLTTLVTLLGPIERIAGAARISFTERIPGHRTLEGRTIQVTTPTYISGVMEFAAGVIATVTMTFDIWEHHMPRIEIYGSKGTISVPDPNNFGGQVMLWQMDTREWREVPLTHDSDVQRGLGLADMAYAIANGRPLRASGDLALHVLEAMLAFRRSAETGAHITLNSTVEQPAAIAVGDLDEALAQ